MALSHAISSGIVLLLISIGVTKSCHPLSKELHICLNIYLERDFPLIETILKGQKQRSYGGRILLEGPDLQRICNQIGLLRKCYDELGVECDTYWQLERYQRMMGAFDASYFHLCGINDTMTTNIKDVLLSSVCVSQASDYLSECDEHGIHWFIVWKQILRLQVSAREMCLNIDGYGKCVVDKLRNFNCGKKASGIYGSLLEVWIDSWCASGPSIDLVSSQAKILVLNPSFIVLLSFLSILSLDC